MILNIAPCSKPRMTQRDKWKKRQCVVNYFAFRDRIRQELTTIYSDQLLGHGLDVIFKVEMPKSWSKKKKAKMAGEPMQSKPDIDNYIKAILDSLNGVYFVDDRQVVEVFASKKYSNEPRILFKMMEMNNDERGDV